MKFYCFFILLLAFYSSSARSGSDTNLPLIANPILRDSAALNKNTVLYLSTDKDKYLTGDALWFNVFALNAQTLAPSNSDTNLLLLLKNEQNNRIVWSGCFQIQNTHGSGRIIIADSLPTGKYLLSAYTPHSFFKHQERIIAAKELFISDNYDSIRSYNKLNASNNYNIDSNSHFELSSTENQLINIESNTRNNIRFKIYGNRSDSGKYYLRLQCRGILEQIAVVGKLKDSTIVKFSTKGLPSGITEVTLFDNRLRPIAERLVFIHPEEHLYVSIDTLKQQYGPKEKVVLKIHIRDVNGRPISALLSVKSTDSRFLNNGQSNNIWAHTQLLSQLKGKICNPDYYFTDTGPRTLKALDKLLFTQGWHSYSWNSNELDKMASDTPVLADRYKARLIRKNGKPNKKPISIIAFNPFKKKEERKIFATTDSTGYFDITPEMQSLGADYMIKYFAKDNQKIISLSPTDTPTLLNKPFTNSLLDQHTQGINNIIPQNDSLNDAINDNERVVNITAKDNSRDRYLSELDSTDYAETPDFIHYAYSQGQNGERFYAAEIHSKPIKDSTLFSKGAYTYSEGELFGQKITIIAPKKDTTKPLGATLFDKFNLIEMNGFTSGKVFYSPDYDREDSTMEDSRNTLYWNPEIITDTNGIAVVSFFTSDVRGRFEIMVEGVAGNGLMGSGTSSFYVRKEEN